MTDPLDQIMDVMEASFDPQYREAWTRTQVSDSLIFPSSFFILVDHQGNLCDGSDEAAGFVLARRTLDEVELLLIAVRPEYRGVGIGSKLMEMFLSKAAAADARKVFLEVRTDNDARTLYRKLGFEQIGTRPAYYRTVDGRGIDAATYAKTL